MNVLITGGAGFIGSHFTKFVVNNYTNYQVVVIDKLNYRGNLANLKEIEGKTNYKFIRGDICVKEDILPQVSEADVVVNFAAETFVDRAIMDASDFLSTDVFGVYNLLEAIRGTDKVLIHISTDEVYGSLEEGFADENYPLRPGNPYSASKASGDLLILSYANTYGIRFKMVRPSNNFGPNQYPENLVPLFITNAIEGRPLPIYGDGQYQRDWIYVMDTVRAIDLVMHEGEIGEIYNVGGGNIRTNLEITEEIIERTGASKDLMVFVDDRQGHDRRYALDSSKIKELGFEQRYEFGKAMELTVNWYRENEDWWRPIKSGEFREYYEKQYRERLSKAGYGE
ncbi:MAG TPA: dTDP-glucose 4,6-dehydratase [Firmicutes bacterium]|nr:dTDP-glucose 4,6-dehydratase [Bacillota bacterium]